VGPGLDNSEFMFDFSVRIQTGKSISLVLVLTLNYCSSDVAILLPIVLDARRMKSTP